MSNVAEAYQLFHDGILALAKVEQAGLRIDLDYIKTQKEQISKTIQKLERKFIASQFYTDWKKSVKKEINIYSPTQLSHYLYNVKKLKVHKQTKTEQGSTDEETLAQLGIPELDILLRIKKLKKVRDTYLDSFERETVDGYMHPFYNLHLVRSYRSSADSPNFQNIPKRDKEAMDICRGAIFPRPGNQLVELDFKQLEVRMAACITGDQQLISDILTGDMHRDMAIEIFEIRKFNKDDPSHSVLRNATKNGFVFPQFYGDYYKNCTVNMAFGWGKLSKTRKWRKGEGIVYEDKHLADHLIERGFTSLQSFTEHIRKIEEYFWKKRYQTYAQWKEDAWRLYQKTGVVESLTGFIFKGVMRKNEVTNLPMQSIAFHCLLWSLIEGVKAQTTEHWQSKIVGQIHDSIVLDIYPPELEHVLAVMRCIMCHDILEHWKWITVPLEIDTEISPIDCSWAEKKPYKIENNDTNKKKFNSGKSIR